MSLADLVFWAGAAQLSILIASAMVPFQLDWKKELASLSLLHRQMYWVYGGYVVLAIISFGILSMLCAEELASRSGLARGLAAYIALFWGIRLLLQAIFDAKPFLTKWYLRIGYHTLTVLFVFLTAIYGWIALGTSPH